ncbi:MAG: hypothetical protein Q4B67_03720 [Eubacteriales bacterium]|nr:hypothetical protein [Eubacteriales bacterium]
MDFEVELKNRNMNIRVCSQKSGIPYATLYPIIKGQIDIGTCTYYTVEKLAKTLGYRPDQIVYHNEDFQTFRNNLHHKIKRNDLKTVLGIIESDDVEYYRIHNDFRKMMYLVATVDYISKKYDIPLCDKYNEVRTMKLEEPFFVGDSALMNKDINSGIDEFARYNIIEGDLYDAV